MNSCCQPKNDNVPVMAMLIIGLVALFVVFGMFWSMNNRPEVHNTYNEYYQQVAQTAGNHSQWDNPK